MVFKWPQGEFRIATSMKFGAYRNISDLLGDNQELGVLIKHLGDQGIKKMGDLLGRNPSDILSPDKVGHAPAERCCGMLQFYGVVPASMIKTIDPSGGFASYPNPEPP